ncbi:MAG: hypothetical protein AAFV98_09955 [Chloroflexota bacterium]
MPYVIQSLPQKSVVSATIHETVSIDELKFVLRDIHKRVKNRSANTLTHIVLDTTSQVFPSKIPVKGFMLVLAKLHEVFYRKRTIVLWLATDSSYYDMAGYYTQRMCVPVHIHCDVNAIYKRIHIMESETARLNESKYIAPFTTGIDEVITQILDE